MVGCGQRTRGMTPASMRRLPALAPVPAWLPGQSCEPVAGTQTFATGAV
ncbi:hypothetical protein D8I24_1629 [Cupriavidus necator H850]|nr:hypothetical protein D8I24_1629 [Cupriavidus necator H850]